MNLQEVLEWVKGNENPRELKLLYDFLGKKLKALETENVSMYDLIHGEGKRSK